MVKSLDSFPTSRVIPRSTRRSLSWPLRAERRLRTPRGTVPARPTSPSVSRACEALGRLHAADAGPGTHRAAMTSRLSPEEARPCPSSTPLCRGRREPVLEQIVGLKLREMDAVFAAASPSPRIRAPASLVLVTYRINQSAGDAAEEANAALWPSQNASRSPPDRPQQRSTITRGEGRGTEVDLP